MSSTAPQRISEEEEENKDQRMVSEATFCLSTCLLLVSLLFFLALGFIIVARKAQTLTGMCHCGLCVSVCLHYSVCVCGCVCACMHVCDRVHAPMCNPEPVFAECRQTDEGKALFIYRFTWSFTVLFWRTHSSCPHCFTMTSHALQCVSLNESFSLIFHLKNLIFLKQEEKSAWKKDLFPFVSDVVTSLYNFPL